LKFTQQGRKLKFYKLWNFSLVKMKNFYKSKKSSHIFNSGRVVLTYSSGQSDSTMISERLDSTFGQSWLVFIYSQEQLILAICLTDSNQPFT